MEQIQISSGPNSLTVYSDIKMFSALRDSDFLYKYIPKVKISDNVANVSNNFKLQIYGNIEDLQFKFDLGSNSATLFGKYKGNLSLRDIISVIDYCLDYVRQKSGIYNVHGSAVSKDNKGILIIGSVSGLGKTTLALNLCSKFGYEFIGDEKILVDKDGMILGGASMIEFNKPDLYLSVNPNLNNKVEQELELVISIQKNPVPLTLVIQPMIVPNGDLYIEEWPPLKSEWHLYEEMGRKIRGVSRRLNNHSYPLDSIDTSEISLLRSETAKNLSTKTKAMCLRGDVCQVMLKINEYIDSSTV